MVMKSVRGDLPAPVILAYSSTTGEKMASPGNTPWRVCTGDLVELVDDDENAVLRHLLLRDRGDNVRKYGREVCRGSSRLRLCLASEDFPMPRFPTIAMFAPSDTSAR